MESGQSLANRGVIDPVDLNSFYVTLLLTGIIQSAHTEGDVSLARI